LHSRGVSGRLRGALAEALRHVQELQASVGRDVADIEKKKSAKKRMDEALEPLKVLARAWAGAAMLGAGRPGDAEYERLIQSDAPHTPRPLVTEMLRLGEGAVAYDLTFPEVFYGSGDPDQRSGFDVILTNPP